MLGHPLADHSDMLGASQRILGSRYARAEHGLLPARPPTAVGEAARLVPFPIMRAPGQASAADPGGL